MRTRGILFALSIFAFLTLGGCTWYVTDGYYDEEGSWFCEGDQCWECQGDRCWPDQGACRSDNDCAPGCFCVPEGGWCEETAFCDVDADCREGYECDDRDTCVPAGDPTNPDPPTAPECSDERPCDDGTTCQDGTCVPTCENDGQCGDGEICDIETNTCVPGQSPDVGSCNGPVTCDIAVPDCPTGTTPGIADGCYTGACIIIEQCDVPPPPPPAACADLPDEDACRDRSDCFAVYSAGCEPLPEFPDASCTEEPAKCECGGDGEIKYLGCLPNP